MTRVNHLSSTWGVPARTDTEGPFRSHPHLGKLNHREQLDAVRRMAEAARDAGIPPELPVMVALVESHLGNPPNGDRDSVGMFQQRRPWGPRSQRNDIDDATRAFLHGGRAAGTFGATHFLSEYGAGPYTDQQLGDWAQDIQGSAYPERYAEEADAARRVLHRAGVDGY